MGAKIKYILKEEQKKINENISYIMGVLLGDGYIYHNKLKGVFFIGLETKDKDFALKFKKELEIWSGGYVSLRERIRKFDHTTKYNDKFNCIGHSYIITFSSKMFSRFVLDLKYSFIKKLKEKNNLKYIKSFLLGFYDSEGHISLQKQIGLTHKKKELLIEIRELLIRIGFKKVPIYEKECGKFYQIILCGRKNLDRFKKEIGFTIIRKKEKLDNFLKGGGKYFLPEVAKRNIFLIPKITKLRKKGYSYRKISKELGIGYGSVYKKLNGTQIPKGKLLVWQN